MIGKRFGYLVVVNQDGKSRAGRGCGWICQCDCGKEVRRTTSILVRKVKVSSCGCMQRKNSAANFTPAGCVKAGITRRRFKTGLQQDVYRHLRPKAVQAISRCTDMSNRNWKHYGGRGIKVVKEWIKNPAEFIIYIASLAGCMDRLKVLDRINNEGHYTPGNLRFITWSESQLNRRTPKRTACKEREFIENNYRSLKIKRGDVSQRQFAAALNIAHRNISLIERGITRGIGESRLVCILCAYGVSIK